MSIRVRLTAHLEATDRYPDHTATDIKGASQPSSCGELVSVLVSDVVSSEHHRAHDSGPLAEPVKVSPGPRDAVYHLDDWCHTHVIPTAHPRHQVTETPAVARALDRPRSMDAG